MQFLQEKINIKEIIQLNIKLKEYHQNHQRIIHMVFLIKIIKSKTNIHMI